MREGWIEVSLKEVSTKIGDGLHGTPKYSEFGEYFFINGNNLKNGKIQINAETKRLDEAEYFKIKKDLSRRTILVAINGTLGNIGLYNDEKIALGKSACYINIKVQYSKNYIRYIIESTHFQKYAELFATGSTIKNLGLKAVRNYKFNLPPLPTQRKIASILSAYDDLIENNLKRIKLLEEKAQLTYEEWFVRMKFPGHETAVFDEESGLPEGWEKVKLVDYCDLTMGQSPKSEFYNDGGKGLPFHQGVKDYGFRFPTNASWSTQGSRVAEENSILFSVRAPVGRLNVAIEKIILGRGLAAINHKKGWNSFALYQLQNIFFEDNLMGGGAIFSSVTKKDVEGIKLIHATEQITGDFNNMASSIDESIKNLTKQNQLLKEARDILLPRLMSGMVDVGTLI